MIINRHTDNARSPLMTIYLRDSSTPLPSDPVPQPASSNKDLSKAPPPAPHESIVTIDMKNKQSAHILEFFLAETQATPLQPSPEEVKEMQELEALKKQGEVDRERLRKIKEEKKKEEDMLKRARAAAGLSEEA